MKTEDGSTRKVIVTMLKTKGPLSAGEMAKQLGITEMAVRRHLHTLERDQLIEAKLVRQAMGRPAHLYSLTEHADDLFPKKYQHLAMDLLEELELTAGADKVDFLFDRRKERLISRYRERMDAKDWAGRVKELAAIQNANGYMVDLEQLEDGTYLLQEFNCPIAQVANQYNHACSCELAMFQSLLGPEARIERTECLAKGGGKCTYEIRQLSAAGDAEPS
ncbi:helix-turn-helix transcriptional regulator [Paenibacillus mucilaginosus]|uniref:Transcriptional regulator n=2 Tax=Paenibacillus mucilaginosus TaxID=61624 RepID=I0BEW6_9BACL|nr:metalloregulator ArsR/SmtB family transcription factor [Paenibacillus mucilaginosus]AEI40083.1 transcriptional regulatory protein [Paenibacillus mucilaginosus KNP414]AFH60913.1 transcriptional regulator [Paenibacillus mucilaginosus K02]MCG7215689.1 transcriptional regulator [Paenibacillus mucilaginosus]WDM29321.1 transcriptional regulator [Paenibacillus mucilaginosus]WFA17507.1 transcriptional regulator [Paenibacillus mucilaginosus]